MSKKSNIRVVATDGKITKKILWINRTSKHICYGWDIPGNIGHFTYHESGKLHYKLKGQVIGEVSQRIPLKDFKGRIQVGSGGFNKKLNDLPNVDFDFKKVEGLVWVDIRTVKNLQNDCCNIDFQLIEPKKTELIYCRPEDLTPENCTTCK